MAKPRTLANTVSDGGPLADGSISASEVSGLAAVATSGSFNDLGDKPTANSYLPTQTSQSGKFLTTDGTNASWATVVSLGSGGTTASGSVTLTAASAALQSITPTANGQSVTLPNATTLQRGITLFSIVNVSDTYQLGIRDAGGTLRAVVAPNGTVTCGLLANATAAGTWTFSTSESMQLVSEAIRSTTYTNNLTTAGMAIPLGTSTLTLAQSNSDWYVQAYDTTTGTFGTPVLIVSFPTWQPRIVALTSTTALCFYRTSGYVMNAVVVTVSGSTCTLGTLSSNSTAFPSTGGYSYDTSYFIAVSPTLAVLTTLFLNGSTYYYSMLAISVSGTTATVGTARFDLYSSTSASVTAAPGNGYLYAETSTRVFHSWNTGANATMEANVFSISGTTISAGTGASFFYNYAVGTSKLFLIQAGKHLITYYDNSTIKARLYTVSGTAVTVGAEFNTGVTGSGAVVQQVIPYGSTRFFYTTQVSSTWTYGVLLDTSGTLSNAIASTTYSTTLLSTSFVGFFGNALYAGTRRLIYDGNATITFDAVTSAAPALGYLTIGTTLLSATTAIKNGINLGTTERSFNLGSARASGLANGQAITGNKVVLFGQSYLGAYGAYTYEVIQ